MPAVFLDQQSLGLRPYLERAGLQVRDVTEILGNSDTSKGVSDEKVRLFVASHPELILVTKDRSNARLAREEKLRVIFVDESEVAAADVLRQLALAEH